MNAPNVTRLPAVLLTPRDFTRLESIARTQLAAGNLVGRFLRRELERAVVCLPEQMPATVITMRSQVGFQLDEQEPVTRTLTFPEEVFGGGQCVSIASPLGAALIGLSEGAVMPFRDHQGKLSRVSVQRVAQPPSYGGLPPAA